MTASRSSLLISILLITVGSGWLLTSLGVIPEINWLWTLSLAVIGLLVFILLGWDKVTAVIGTFFLLTSLLSVLRQTGQLSINVEVPILVISSGVLIMIARVAPIPVPRWIIEEHPQG